MTGDIVDLTLDDSSDDEAARRPAKRPRSPDSEDDEVMVLDEVVDAAPATEAAAARAGELADGEELRITDSSLEVWNQDLPHQRHQCGRHPFTKAACASNKESCRNCYCFVCDKVASECSNWGTGALPSDHCNSYPDPASFYASLRSQHSAATPARGDAGLSSMLPNLDTPTPRASSPTPDDVMYDLGKYLERLRERLAAAPEAAVDELSAPGGADMLHLGEVRLRCKAGAPGVTLSELDAKLHRHGVYTTCSRLPPAPNNPLHIANLFPWGRCSGHGSARPPLELLPFDVPPSEAVPPERTVPVVVFRCDGSSGRPMTYGVEVHFQNDTTVGAVMAKAKQAAGVMHEPLGGVLWGRPKHQDSSLDRGISLLPPTAAWDLQGSLVMVIPGVDEHCKTALQLGSGKHDPRHQAARLVVYLQLLLGDAQDERSVGPPIALIVTAEIAGGGRAAEKAVQQAVMRVLKPILKPGAQPPPAVFQHCMHCSEGGSLGYHQPVPFSQRGVLRSEFGMPTAYVAATVTDQARASYDLYKLAKPAAHSTAAPHVLAASRARHRESEKQRHAKDSAQSDPAAICREIIAAQRCSKPRQWGHSYISNGVHWQQDDIPTLRVRVHLEPDPQDPSQGVAVLQLWTWRSSMAPLATNEPGHKALIPPSPDYLEQWNALRAHDMPRTMQRVLLHDVPGLAEAEAAVQRWSQPRRLDAIKSVPAMLKALETGEVEAATQPAGLTVTLRPYQLQTLGFMQRAESGEDGLRRHIWFPVRANAGAGGSGPESKAQQALWWWSPVYKTCCLQEPPRSCWGGFLGETMGLGKTVEVLALVLSDRAHLPAAPQRLATLYPPDHSQRRQQQPAPAGAADAPAAPESVDGRLCSNATLVVCAVSLVGQWVAEAQSKAGGSLRIYQYHGQGRKRDMRALALDYDVVVTTYATLGSDWRAMSKLPASDTAGRQRRSPLHAVQWYRLVMDESHCAKDVTTGQTKACVALESSRRWCCSGTPLATETADLAGQFAALRMAPFSDRPFFSGRYRNLLTQPHFSYGASPGKAELMYVLSRIMVRHTGAQTTGGETVLALPPLQRSVVEVAFTPGEAEMYRYAHAEAVGAFRSYLAATPGNPAAAASKHLLSIMSLLLPLRRIASGGELSAADVSLPAPRAVRAESGAPGAQPVALPAEQLQCPVCLDAPDAPVRTPCGHWFCRECIVGALERACGATCPLCRAAVDVSALQPGVAAAETVAEPAAAGAAEPGAAPVVACNSKLRALVAELHAMRARDGGAKALVFSQFNSTIEWLKHRLPGEGFAFRTIDGSMPMKKRAAAIADFQGDPPTTVFLLSMRAGAVGINLTAASHVFLLEPALNPALEEQAIGRAWRMGQTRSVVVKRFFVKGTVEANIMELNKQRAGGGGGGSNSAAPGQPPGGEAGPSGAARRGNKGLKQQEVVGSVHTDRQNLKLGELELLFRAPSI